MIKREEIIGDCRLLLGDCREILPTLKGQYDGICTDPPYGLGKRMQGGTWGAQDHNSGFLRWDLEAPSWLPDLIEGYPSIVWGGNYLPFPPSRCWLAWVKPDAPPSMASMELAWTNLDQNARLITHSISATNAERVGHPTQKPLPLMIWCLGFFPDAKTILDPFMGSGTTGVACVREGRSFIGIEIDEGYFEIACRRIRDEYARPRLALEPPAKPVQEPLL